MTSYIFHVDLDLLQSQKMLDEKQAKKKVKEVEKMEKAKRLQKLKSQVRYRYGQHRLRARSPLKGSTGRGWGM